jgi:hypothetical protein
MLRQDPRGPRTRPPLIQTWVGVGLALALLSAPHGSAAPGLSALEIMRLADARDDGERRTLELELSLIDRNGQTRARSVRIFSRDLARETQQIIFFLSPADVKDTGLLSYDYTGAERDDDQWLYLPALRKTKRLASADQSGAFLGSDFNYSDLTRREIDDYTYTLLGVEDVRGAPTWQIEAIPRSEHEAKRTGYSKSVLFVRQDNYFVVRAVHWVRDGEKLKYQDVKKLEQIDGIWVATEISMTTKKGQETVHKTLLRVSKVDFASKLDDQLFTIRQLEKGPL